MPIHIDIPENQVLERNANGARRTGGMKVKLWLCESTGKLF
jgi:hypothetical protein